MAKKFHPTLQGLLLGYRHNAGFCIIFTSTSETEITIKQKLQTAHHIDKHSSLLVLKEQVIF